MNEWKVKSVALAKGLTSRPTLDVATDTPGPRFDYEGTLPLEEITFITQGVALDDTAFAPFLTAARARGQIVTVPSKLGSFTGKMTAFVLDNHDGTPLHDCTLTLRMEQPT